jgi:uncharacterized protein (TIGR00269 family)
MMVNCVRCGQRAVFSNPAYCEFHFIDYFEAKVKSTIERFGLLAERDRIAVAVSGGKDSQTTAFLLKKFYGNVTAIAIDEGIPGYRDQKLDDLRLFCTRYDIPFEIYSFKEAFGKPLEEFLSLGAPSCRSCGVMRRHLLNKNASGFDVIATGHNLDDECQSIVMNLLKGNVSMAARIGPKSGVIRDGFTQRIKPLYLCTEREVAAYAFLMKFPVQFNECPHADDGFRSRVRDALNELECAAPGSKLRIVENFIKLRVRGTHEALQQCNRCGGLAAAKVCGACRVVEVYVH